MKQIKKNKGKRALNPLFFMVSKFPYYTTHH